MPRPAAPERAGRAESTAGARPGGEDGRRLPAAFARLAWSNLAAQSAEQVALAAAPLVAVLVLGAGPGQTGLLQTAQTLPLLLVSLPAGMLADRGSRARLMTVAEGLRALALAVTLGLLLGGRLTLGWLALLGFAGACGTIAYSVAAPSLIPGLVAPGALTAANGRIELARTTAFAAGPALGGALVGWTGPAPAFAVATLLSVGAVLLLAGLREPPRAPAPVRHPLHDAREGIAFVFGHPLLRPVFATQVIFNTAFFVVQAVYVPYALGRLGLSPSAVGATLATYGVGMVLGVLLAPRVLRAVPFGTVIVLGPLGGLVAAAVLVLTIWTPSFWLAAASFFLMGAGPVLWTITTTTLRQTVTPRALLGRVLAIALFASGARPLGAAIGAAVGGAYGAEACLGLAMVGFVAQAIVILASPVPRLARQPEMRE